MQYLVSNGYTAAADALRASLASDPAAVFPPDRWGPAQVQALLQGTANITVPQDLLAAPQAPPAEGDGDDKTGLIVGLAVGRESHWVGGCRRPQGRCFGSSAPAGVHCGSKVPCLAAAPGLTLCSAALRPLQWAAARCCWLAWASGCGARAAAPRAAARCTATRSRPRRACEPTRQPGSPLPALRAGPTAAAQPFFDASHRGCFQTHFDSTVLIESHFALAPRGRQPAQASARAPAGVRSRLRLAPAPPPFQTCLPPLHDPRSSLCCPPSAEEGEL